MSLEEFIDQLLSNLMSSEGIDKVQKLIKEDTLKCGKDYDTAKVECQVYTEENNYDPRVEITSENYNDGEIIFIDFHVDDGLE